MSVAEINRYIKGNTLEYQVKILHYIASKLKENRSLINFLT